MMTKFIKYSVLFWLSIGIVQGQSSWFVDLNTGLYNHSFSTNKSFVNNIKEKGFTQQRNAGLQFDLILGRKGVTGFHIGGGFKTLRLKTTYSLITTFDQAIGVEKIRETVKYQTSFNFYQLRVGYDHSILDNWMLGLRFSAGFDPSPEMFVTESREETYALFDQVNYFEDGQNMPEPNRAALFGAIELSVGKRFDYFSIFIYGRITGVRQQQDMRYPIAALEPSCYIRYIDNVRLNNQINELGISVRIPLWFIP